MPGSTPRRLIHAVEGIRESAGTNRLETANVLFAVFPQPSGQVHALVEDADHTDVATGQLFEEDEVTGMFGKGFLMDFGGNSCGKCPGSARLSQ